jgi:phosphomannomutase
MSIFKAYDIRGLVPEQLDAELAYGIGRATAKYLGGETLVVGWDARTSADAFSEAVLRAVADEGVNVIALGPVATPMLYFAVEEHAAAGGIMITASHNPGQYNGFKICREHAIPVGGASGLKEIEQLVPERSNAPVAASRGGVTQVDITEDYVRHVKKVGGDCPKLRVAMDCGNGMAAAGLETLLKDLPLEVERLYFEPDGSFPNHEADPLKEENLADVIAAVKRIGADFGVAFDGDGDRAVFVDEAGRPISSDLVTALLAGPLLEKNPGATVLYDLRSSRATAEAIREKGGVAEMCRVGHSFVKAHMRENGAIFGGELSGHFYFRFSDNLIADDGIAAFVAMLQLLASEQKPMSELVAPLRRYVASGEINSRVTDTDAVIAAIEAEYAEGAEVSHLDGLLVQFSDWWFNLRPSNTEPVIRLNLEAGTVEEMEQRRDAILDRIADFSS